jgi:hypothetical protein
MEEQAEKPDYMTDEQFARFMEWQRAHPYGDQDENGIDLSLLRANLKLTPLERLQKLVANQEFLRATRELSLPPEHQQATE